MWKSSDILSWNFSAFGRKSGTVGRFYPGTLALLEGKVEKIKRFYPGTLALLAGNVEK